MSIHKIHFIPIKLPQATKDFVVGQIYSYEPPPGLLSCQYEVDFKTSGDYEIEYWATDNAGNIEPPKRLVFSIAEQGISFPGMHKTYIKEKIEPSSKQVVLENGPIRVLLHRSPEGLGADFNWEELDLQTLDINNDNDCSIIEIKQGGWLARRLNNLKNTLAVSVNGGQDVVLMLNTPVPLTKSGVLRNNLPKLVQNYIDKVYKENNEFHFTIKRACKLKILRD